MIKIFIQNKPLYLVDTIKGELEEYMQRQETIYIDELSDSSVKTMLQQLQQNEFDTGILLHPDTNESLKAFKNHLKVIQAAGGLVYTNAHEVLLIFRKGKWDLPKGKLDKGEGLEECALREIEEETGVDKLTIEQQLQVTYHTYHEKGKHILKESHWYLVRRPNKSNLIPQTEEDIELAEWVALENLPRYMDNMHSSIVDVVKKATEILEKR